jgi:competence ComEA-like helix-hairpin-helix protein
LQTYFYFFFGQKIGKLSVTMHIKLASFAVHNMKQKARPIRSIALFAALAFVVLALFVPVAPAQTQYPDGPGKATFLKICSNCHAPDNVIGKGQSADLDYLSTNFPPIPDKINVNTATAWNLRNWMNFSDKQANAVVDYRKQNGDFKSLDDLKKVPGLDPKVLDAKKDRITF